jgi:hypothetical protein
MDMIAKTAFAAALLLSVAPALAEDAHHPPTSDTPATGTPPESAAPPPAGSAPAQGQGTLMPGSMMGGGMMGGDMMKMMQEMMGGHAGMMRGMMSGAMGQDGMMGQMMAPEHVEGRIAFLRTELKVTDAQQPLWNALAEAIRANAGAADEMMTAMRGGMPMGASDSTAPQRMEAQEKALSARLESVRRLKAALEPFYAAIDASQKERADRLLVPAPMGMM